MICDLLLWRIPRPFGAKPKVCSIANFHQGSGRTQSSEYDVSDRKVGAIHFDRGVEREKELIGERGIVHTCRRTNKGGKRTAV